MLLKAMRSPRSEYRWRKDLRALPWSPSTLNIGEKRESQQQKRLKRESGKTAKHIWGPGWLVEILLPRQGNDPLYQMQLVECT